MHSCEVTDAADFPDGGREARAPSPADRSRGLHPRHLWRSMFAKDFGEIGLRQFGRTTLSQGFPYAAVFPSRPRRLGTSANRSTRSLDLRAETCGSRGIGRVSAYSNVNGNRETKEPRLIAALHAQPLTPMRATNGREP